MSPHRTTQEGIPILDISAWLSDSSSQQEREVVVEELRESCTTYGFFQLVGHGIPEELMQQVLDCGKLFFELPLEQKMSVAMKNSVGSSNRGYEVLRSQTLQKGALPDLKEGYVVGTEMSSNDPRAGRFLQGPNLWPQNLDSASFRAPIQDYHARMVFLAELVLELLRVALPVSVAENLFDDFKKQPSANLRLLHYPPQISKDERQYGAGAHTDFGAISFNLQQHGTSGLEVWHPSTEEWISVKPERGVFVVNIGDLLQMWTCGYYRSATHRVINTLQGDRYSAPFFYNGNMDSHVEPIRDLAEKSCSIVGGTRVSLSVEDHFRSRLRATHP